MPLDHQGHAEAEQAAATLADRPITLVVASPLIRAQETAAPIAKLVGVDIETDADLFDLDHGSWEALTPAEAEADDPARYATWRKDPRSCTPPGGEAMARVEERIVRSVDRWGSVAAGAEVVMVSHEIPIRLLISRIRGIDGAAIWEVPLTTGSVTRLCGVPGSWRFDGYGDR